MQRIAGTDSKHVVAHRDVGRTRPCARRKCACDHTRALAAPPRNPPPAESRNMNKYSLHHVADHTLLTHLDGLDARDRGTTAELIAHLAEVDERKLYVPIGYTCMRDYCIHGRGYSEDVAKKRIRAARTARRFPVIFEMLADGRLHLCGV